MSSVGYLSHGPIGTKLGTFIIDDNLQIANIHVPINLYNKYLTESINIGIKWLHKKIEDSSIDQRYPSLFNKFITLIENNGFTDDINQNIIEMVCSLSNKLNKKTPTIDNIRSSQEIKPPSDYKKEKHIHHLGPHNLSDLTEQDIDFTRGIMVQMSTGKYELFFYVRHDDHNDILPYEYIFDKIKNIPTLMVNGYKLNK